MVSEKHIQRAANLAKEGQTFEGRRDRIAAALAKAEREGMRCAAEIVSGLSWQIDLSPDHVRARKPHEYGDAILAEITNQPGSSSLPADSAPEAGSSPVSGVTHSNPRLTSAGTPPVDAANCESIAQAADASPSYSEQEG